MTGRYTIAAKPTTYRAVRFRSQLEACWAHIFDQIGMPWEYEPRVEISGWLPDFRLFNRFLVEVKPTAPHGYSMAFDEFDFFAKAVRSQWTILLGNGPGDNFGAITVNSEDGHGAKTFLYDPDQPCLMRSVDGDGSSDRRFGALNRHWRAAQEAFSPTDQERKSSQEWRRK